MPDIDVDQAGLDAIARRLRTASTDLEGAPVPPEPPQAGDASGILASILSHMSLSIDGAITGLGAAGEAVAESRDLFQDTEHENRDSIGAAAEGN